MATIHDLHQSISTMNNEEALQLILKRRESRLISKKKPPKSKTTSPSRSKKADSMSPEALFSVMSAEEKQKLLKYLKGK